MIKYTKMTSIFLTKTDFVLDLDNWNTLGFYGANYFKYAVPYLFNFMGPIQGQVTGILSFLLRILHVHICIL